METSTMEFRFKILVVGDVSTGKTSLLQQYVNGSFDVTSYKPTLGVDFLLKNVQGSDGSLVTLEFWDIQGQERPGCMTRNYYKNAVMALVVFDCTRVKTFESVARWKKDLNKILLEDGSPIPCFLLGNKADLPKHPFVPECALMDRYALDQGFQFWRWTSTKNGNGLAGIMPDILSMILSSRSPSTEELSSSGLILQTPSLSRDESPRSIQPRAMRSSTEPSYSPNPTPFSNSVFNADMVLHPSSTGLNADEGPSTRRLCGTCY